jgi:hypothetical protein
MQTVRSNKTLLQKWGRQTTSQGQAEVSNPEQSPKGTERQAEVCNPEQSPKQSGRQAQGR